MEQFYYVTKYALTDGVLMVRRDKCELFADGTALKWGRWMATAHGNGKEWHETRESAEKRVEVIKERKRASIAKSLAKLDKPIKFREWVQE